jgi:hypothetical protein
MANMQANETRTETEQIRQATEEEVAAIRQQAGRTPTRPSRRRRPRPGESSRRTQRREDIEAGIADLVRRRNDVWPISRSSQPS